MYILCFEIKILTDWPWALPSHVCSWLSRGFRPGKWQPRCGNLGRGGGLLANMCVWADMRYQSWCSRTETHGHWSPFLLGPGGRRVGARCLQKQLKNNSDLSSTPEVKGYPGDTFCNINAIIMMQNVNSTNVIITTLQWAGLIGGGVDLLNLLMHTKTKPSILKSKHFNTCVHILCVKVSHRIYVMLSKWLNRSLGLL